MERLPDDVVADVLRRVAPRGLAVSRCVYRPWRALIDGRRLLRADLLIPRSLAGFFLCYHRLDQSEFLARAGAGVDHITMPRGDEVDDHCNGLVLQSEYCVLNPATGRRAFLPDRPLPLLHERYFLDYDYLAFDPADSPHYQVFSVPMVLVLRGRRVDPRKADDPAVYAAISRSEWPPSPFHLSVFSSATGRWEARPFVRQGEAAGTVADRDDPYLPRHSVCCRGALYVQRENNFVFRISLSEDTYRVIKPPKEIEALRGGGPVHLGRSNKGVSYAFIDDERHLLWFWTLDDDDSCGTTDWILRYRCCLSGLALATPRRHGPSWILQNVNSRDDEGGNDDDEALALAGQQVEWDSDDEDILGTEGGIQGRFGFTILGFHPYKDIVFLHASMRCLAYHLKSSKLEDLGDLYPKNYVAGAFGSIDNAFPYTPCWMGEL
ncbi:unnamed protein product [Urochloa humidicola]